MLPRFLSQVLHSTSSINPLYVTERAGLASSAAVRAMLDPNRADMVALLSETTGYEVLQSLRDRIVLTDEGKRLLIEKPRITSETLEKVSQMPLHTFGGAYSNFMRSQGFVPESRLEVSTLRKYYEKDDVDDVAYVLQRYRESHDLWHVLVGLDTSVKGELAQKWFEMLQTGLFMCAISSFVGPLRLSISDQLELVNVYIPWAIQCNSSCAFLLSKRLEDSFDRDLEDVRKDLGIVVSPKPFIGQ